MHQCTLFDYTLEQMENDVCLVRKTKQLRACQCMMQKESQEVKKKQGETIITDVRKFFEQQSKSSCNGL